MPPLLPNQKFLLVGYRNLKLILEREELAADKKLEEDIFYVSDFTESFAKTTNIFYGKEIRLELNNIWKNT